MSVTGNWKQGLENMLCVQTADQKSSAALFFSVGVCTGLSASLKGAAPRILSPRWSGLKPLTAQEVALCLVTVKEKFCPFTQCCIKKCEWCRIKIPSKSILTAVSCYAIFYLWMRQVFSCLLVTVSRQDDREPWSLKNGPSPLFNLPVDWMPVQDSHCAPGTRTIPSIPSWLGFEPSFPSLVVWMPEINRFIVLCCPSSLLHPAECQEMFLDLLLKSQKNSKHVSVSKHKYLSVSPDILHRNCMFPLIPIKWLYWTCHLPVWISSKQKGAISIL